MSLDAVRWAVVDCETSGLDPARDRLLSVGAVAVRGMRIELSETYSAVLQQRQPSAAHNILIHGIGADAQLGGRPAQEVVHELDSFIGDGVPAAFPAAFDAAVLKRAGLPARKWLDLEPVARALFPDRARTARALDDWLLAFAIQPVGRHDALLDALATAELLLVLLAEAARQRIATLEDLMAAAGGSRWLPPG